MPNKLFISTIEAGCGKSLISLGVMGVLLRTIPRVGFFRPIIGGRKGKDKHISLVLSRFGLNFDHDECYAYKADEVVRLTSEGRYDEVLEGIFEKYKKLEERCDFVLCESSSYEGITGNFDLELNIDIAKAIGAPVLLVSNGHNKDPGDVAGFVKIAVDAYINRDCKIVSVIVNKAKEFAREEILSILRRDIGKHKFPINVIPESETLNAPTVGEIAEQIGAKVLYGGLGLNNQVRRYSIAAMHLQNYLTNLSDHCMVITPGDRGDIIVGTMLASTSKNYPTVSGIVLSCGQMIDEAILKLIDGLPNPIPVLSYKKNTFETASALEKVQSSFSANNKPRIELGLRNFEAYVDVDSLVQNITEVKSTAVSPKMFEYNILKLASQNKQHIVLPESNDERILRAADKLLAKDVVDITLIGDEEEIKRYAANLGLSLDKAKFVQPAKSPNFERYLNMILEARKHKGVSEDAARDALMDVSYFGTMMVHSGDADGMVSGACHTTQHTIRPALQIIKTKKDCSIVSSIFLMCLADRVVAYGDCAVNPNPNERELAEIAIASADTAASFGIAPRVAMLSYSSGDSGQGADVELVRRATSIVRDLRPDIEVEGPIQYDAAVDMGVAAKKLPNSKVAGRASVLVFPDLNTGNNTYKAVQRETKALAIGPIMQGLNKPVNDLSRGCTVDDVFNTIVITAIQAVAGKRK